MTSFQIIMIVVSIVTVLGAVIGLFFKTTIQIAKVETDILNIKQQLTDNREDHLKISEKLDNILQKIKPC